MMFKFKCECNYQVKNAGYITKHSATKTVSAPDAGQAVSMFLVKINNLQDGIIVNINRLSCVLDV